MTIRRAALLSLTLAASSAFSQGAPTLPELDLGDQVPVDATKTAAAILASPAQFQRLWIWQRQSVEYKLGVDDSGFVQFIFTSSDCVSTPEGVRVGQRWADLQGIAGARVGQWPGWGKVAVLPSGWNAASALGGVNTTADIVEGLFKGTLAGHGRRTPVSEAGPASK